MTAAPVIAIVDDDQLVRAGLGSLVRSYGYGAALFASGEACLSADVTGFACVVSDVQMPGMSGLELQRALGRRAPGMPVIFLTAFPEASIRAQAVAQGALCFLEKPCDPDILLARLREAIGPADR